MSKDKDTGLTTILVLIMIIAILLGGFLIISHQGTRPLIIIHQGTGPSEWELKTTFCVENNGTPADYSNTIDCYFSHGNFTTGYQIVNVSGQFKFLEVKA